LISLQIANEERVFPAYYRYSEIKQFIGSGWKEFALRNNLKVKDMCLFEVKKLGAELAVVVHVPT
jgi:B3 DNA binding domain